jgi:hypothetical protein
MRKQWQDCKKIKDAGYKVVSNWGCEFRKLLLQNPGLEKELGSHLYVKNAPINLYRTHAPARLRPFKSPWYEGTHHGALQPLKCTVTHVEA